MTFRPRNAMDKAASPGFVLIFAGIVLSSHVHAFMPAADPVSTTHPKDGVPAEERRSGSPSAAPRNAFAENLRPAIKRPTTFQNQPYNPIRRPDDQEQIPEIEMFVGESRVFPAPGVARIAVGNGQIMTAAALDSKEIIIFANGVGTSSLFIWNEDGRYQRVKVNIVPGDTTRIAREVAAFLTTIPDAKASVVGDKVIIEGDNLSDADLAKVEQLEKRYPQIINFTDRIGWEQMVMMDVKVVEFPTTELREMGLKWNSAGGAALAGIWRPIRRGNDGPYEVTIQTGESNMPPIISPSGTGGVVVPSSLNVIGYMNLGLNAQLNLLEQEGKASVLAEPQLSARNGAKATFLAGGEFPYSVSNANGVTIIFKKYGISLEIVPKVDRNGVIRATIEAEVSSIDASVSTIAGPALSTRRTNTEFNVKNGETIVLSGLLQRNSNTEIDKVPFLGDIPLLGALFRSKRFQNKETELVIFVTPTVVDSHSPGLVDRVERTTERLQQQLGRPPYLSNPLQPGHDPAKTYMKPRSSVTDLEVGAAGAGTAAPIADTYGNRGAAHADVAQVQVMSEVGPRRQREHVQASESSYSAGGSKLRVKKEGLVLRAEPNTGSRALLQLGYGALVQLGRADPAPRGLGYWRNVVVGEMNGWVTADGVGPAHLEPEIKSNPLSRVSQTDQEGRRLMAGATAATPGATDPAVRYIMPVDPFATGKSVTVPPRHYRVLLDGLAVRVSPDVNALVVQSLPEGQLVEALPQPPSRYWTAVQVGSRRGWVATQWLDSVDPQN